MCSFLVQALSAFLGGYDLILYVELPPKFFLPWVSFPLWGICLKEFCWTLFFLWSLRVLFFLWSARVLFFCEGPECWSFCEGPECWSFCKGPWCCSFCEAPECFSFCEAPECFSFVKAQNTGRSVRAQSSGLSVKAHGAVFLSRPIVVFFVWRPRVLVFLPRPRVLFFLSRPIVVFFMWRPRVLFFCEGQECCSLCEGPELREDQRAAYPDGGTPQRILQHQFHPALPRAGSALRSPGGSHCGQEWGMLENRTTRDAQRQVLWWLHASSASTEQERAAAVAISIDQHCCIKQSSMIWTLDSAESCFCIHCVLDSSVPSMMDLMLGRWVLWLSGSNSYIHDVCVCACVHVWGSYWERGLTHSLWSVHMECS